jgi:hypothetical protein
MPLFKFQVTLPTDSAIPEDYVTNTWHFFRTPAAPITDYDNVRDMLKDFYTTVPTGGGNALTSFFNQALDGPAIVKAYNVGDPTPRVPVYESTFTFNPTGTQQLPAEVALVFSFQAARASGQSQARRRNRVYLGTWGTTAGGNDGRPSGTLVTQVSRCGATMKAAAIASASWDWVVYSPTDDAYHEVANGWVDNAWDTQRRRGYKPTSRTTFT